jgi:chorismate mutase
MEQESVRALRGATTVDHDHPDEISERTNELLGAMMRLNDLDEEQLISILFTSTGDLVSTFPATAARLNGFSHVPLISAQEIPVLGSAPRCIRVMMHCTTSRARADLHHVYLHGARGLRDDLPS